MKKNNKELLCYDCVHSIREHTNQGCKKCHCQTSIEQYQKPKTLPTYSELDSLRTQLDDIDERLNRLS